jgi:hypothetical protein
MNLKPDNILVGTCQEQLTLFSKAAPERMNRTAVLLARTAQNREQQMSVF